MIVTDLHPGDQVLVSEEVKDLTSEIIVPPFTSLEVVRTNRPNTVIVKYKDYYITLELKYLHRIE